MRTSRLLPRFIALAVCCWPFGIARGQEARPAPTSPAPAALPPAFSNEELMSELRQLRSEVAESRRLKDQVIQLQNEVANLRTGANGPWTGFSATAPGPDFSTMMNGGGLSGTSPGESRFRGGQPSGSAGSGFFRGG